LRLAHQQPRRHADEGADAPDPGEGKVRYVGDHVAMVVADTLEQAKNAAEAVVVDYDVLPAW
jgi:CO/xanthine dehydrogenase Mo-binding subunit